MPGLGATGGGKLQLSVGWHESSANRSYVDGRVNKTFTHLWQPRETLSALDVTARYSINRRVSIIASLPIVTNSFSTLLPPTNSAQSLRHYWHANDIGDTVLFGQTYLYDPKSHLFSNVAVGVGIKIPTGNWDIKSIIPNENGLGYSKRAVYPPSIMPGDGGTDIILGINGFRTFRKPLWLRGQTVFASATYLISPRDTNHTASIVQGLGVPLSPGFFNSLTNSVTDSWNMNFGASIKLPHTADKPKLKGLRGRLAFGWEGIPKYDLFGGSNGYRQPGYTISVAPGFTYAHGHGMFICEVPIVFNRYIDPHDTAIPGLPTVSSKGVVTPAAFNSLRNMGLVAPAAISVRYVRTM
ncbi:MAG TPA: hypothetical protein V6C97_29365 [Oculatellaceae cyanobacterium]